MGSLSRSAQSLSTLRNTAVICLVTILAHVTILWQRSVLETTARSACVSSGGAPLAEAVRALDAKLGDISQQVAADLKLLGLIDGARSDINGIREMLGRGVEERKGFVSSLPRRLEPEEKVKAFIGRLGGSFDLGLDPGRKRVRLVVGVFTGFNDPGRKENPADKDRYNYSKRRKALRDTWFPSTREERDRLETEHGIIVRFILGHTDDKEAEDKVALEAKETGDFIRLPIKESYYGLTNKTKNYFTAAASLYDADWIVKVDDDIYLMMERILMAAKQWDKMGAGYIGCMKHGYVWKEENTRWYEPKHLLLGNQYYLHAYGSIYALPRRTVEDVIIRNFNNLRFFANEGIVCCDAIIGRMSRFDTTVGSWMLSHNVTHFEDMRLCATRCSDAAIGILKNECAGLCNPLKDLYRIHNIQSCKKTPREPLGYMDSYPEHTAFESMRV